MVGQFFWCHQKVAFGNLNFIQHENNVSIGLEFYTELSVRNECTSNKYLK